MVHPIEEQLYLFGGTKPWDATQWTAVDDRVRGGASQSYLLVSPPNTAGHFNGTLDIKTLGGAGFASQKTVFSPPLDLSDYDGLAVEIQSANTKTYTLILKDGEELPKRPDGRLQSTVSWEYDFALHEGEHDVRVVVPWAELKPTYRGRPKDDAEPLDLAKIRSLSIMMRSHFGEQEGEINLTMRSIAAYRFRDGEDECEWEDEVEKEKYSVHARRPERAGRSWYDCFWDMFRGWR